MHPMIILNNESWLNRCRLWQTDNLNECRSNRVIFAGISTAGPELINV